MRSKSQPVVREEPTFIEAARRSQIVQCAIETIAELGYERASLAEIAKRARVSKSVISYYFASKDDLIEQVVTHVYTAAGEFMLPQIESQKTAEAALRAFISTNIAFIGTHRTDVQAVMEIVSSSRMPDGRPRFDVSRQEQSISDLEQLFRWGQQTGEFRAFATDVMAVALRVAVDALGPRLVMYPDIDVEQYAAEIGDLFVNASKKH
jgi:AcrR family transcriptional regulator